MNILFWVVCIILVMCFIFAFINSVLSKDIEQRRTDLLVGCVMFVMFLLLVKVFGGYIL